jgi:hypothetical protein
MKARLLQIIKDVPARKEDVMKVVISSPLSDPFRYRWLNGAVERAIKAVQGSSDVPFWENWASNWLSGTDRTAQSAYLVAQEVNRLRKAQNGEYLKFWDHSASALAAYEAAHRHPSIIDCLCSNTETCEAVREQLYNDMMKLISEMGE